jgi:hypothetical protein
MKEVVIWKVMPWRNSKFGDYQTKRIAMKPTDGSKQVYLNLSNNRSYQHWLPYLKEGNILLVTMHPNGYVNQGEQFRSVDIKAKNKVEA